MSFYGILSFKLRWQVLGEAKKYMLIQLALGSNDFAEPGVKFHQIYRRLYQFIEVWKNKRRNVKLDSKSYTDSFNSTLSYRGHWLERFILGKVRCR